MFARTEQGDGVFGVKSRRRGDIHGVVTGVGATCSDVGIFGKTGAVGETAEKYWVTVAHCLEIEPASSTGR